MIGVENINFMDVLEIMQKKKLNYSFIQKVGLKLFVSVRVFPLLLLFQKNL